MPGLPTSCYPPVLPARISGCHPRPGAELLPEGATAATMQRLSDSHEDDFVLDDDAREWRMHVIEGRREQVDGFMWAIPGFAIASQAFLLTVALRDDAQPTARLIASVAGLIILLSLGQLVGKQVYLFDLYEAFIERERELLKRPGVQLDALRGGAFPPGSVTSSSTTGSCWGGGVPPPDTPPAGKHGRRRRRIPDVHGATSRHT
jgi:hypothetical protein